MSICKTKNKQIETLVDQFAAHLQDAGDSIKAAASCYTAAIKLDKAAIGVFHERFPTIPSSVWSGFCRIADGMLHPDLLFDGTSGGRALAKCDIEMQEVYLSDAVPVATCNGDHLLLPIQKMTSEQVRQVFNHGSIRDLPEQRAWIETQRTRARINNPEKIDKVNDIYVKGSCLHVGDVKLTRAELIKYLGDME